MAKSGWKGVNQTISEIRKFGAEAEAKINAETNSIAFQIAKDAKTAAPKNLGKLAQSIAVSQPFTDKGKAIHTKIVTVNEKYGAYVEFGTGAKVSVPPDFEEIANSYKGQKTGTFQDFIDAMTAYFKQKGYDTKYVWIACINKLNNGMNPQPFLYPAFVKGKNDYERNLNQLLKQLKKKI